MSNELPKINKVEIYKQVPSTSVDYIPYSFEIFLVTNDSRVNNIGIVAPYGSGKTSLIETFKYLYITEQFKMINKDCNLKNGFNNLSEIEFNINEINMGLEPTKKQMKNNNIFLNISFAEFGNNTLAELDPSTSKDKQPSNLHEDIEKEIIQSFIYSVDSKKLPDSSIKRIADNKYQRVIRKVSLLLGTLSLVTLILTSAGVLWNFDLAIFIASLILTVLFLGISFWDFIDFKNLKKIGFSSVSIEIDKETDETYFSKYLDELINFFKKTKYRYIVIEDLDRYNDVSIFKKLRQLNISLNGNRDERDKIKFIYCLKSDIFNSTTEKVKFFDHMIQLPPKTTESIFIQQTYSFLEKYYSKSIKENKEDVILFIKKIVTFIPDIRVLNAIFNEFKRAKLYFASNWQEEKDEDVKIKNALELFTTCAYKTLYTEDFYLSLLSDDNSKNSKSKFLEEINRFEDKIDKIYDFLLPKKDKNEEITISLEDKKSLIKAVDKFVKYVFDNKSKYRVSSKYLNFEDTRYSAWCGKIKTAAEKESLDKFIADKLSSLPMYELEQFIELVVNNGKKDVSEFCYLFYTLGYFTKSSLFILDENYVSEIYDVNFVRSINEKNKEKIISQFNYEIKGNLLLNTILKLNIKDFNKSGVLNYSLFEELFKYGDNTKALFEFDIKCKKEYADKLLQKRSKEVANFIYGWIWKHYNDKTNIDDKDKKTFNLNYAFKVIANRKNCINEFFDFFCKENYTKYHSDKLDYTVKDDNLSEEEKNASRKAYIDFLLNGKFGKFSSLLENEAFFESRKNKIYFKKSFDLFKKFCDFIKKEKYSISKNSNEDDPYSVVIKKM